MGVNRVGGDPNNDYSGRSVIVSPAGEVVADAAGDEGIVRAKLDIAVVRELRESFPALQDIRPSLLPPQV